MLNRLTEKSLSSQGLLFIKCDKALITALTSVSVCAGLQAQLPLDEQRHPLVGGCQTASPVRLLLTSPVWEKATFTYNTTGCVYTTCPNLPLLNPA
nr:hypothetical protein CFP56_69552 [Quercus suber]